MRVRFRLFAPLLLSALCAQLAFCEPAPQDEDLFGKSLEELVNTKVITASKTVQENTFDAAGVVSVITRREIDDFGARNLSQVLERFGGVFHTGSPLYNDSIF